MKVLLNEIPDDSGGKHEVDKGRDEGKKNLEDKDIGKGYESQCAFSRENSTMFEDGLQNSERPTEALAHEGVGGGRSFGEGERHVFVLDAIAVAQESHG